MSFWHAMLSLNLWWFSPPCVLPPISKYINFASLKTKWFGANLLKFRAFWEFLFLYILLHPIRACSIYCVFERFEVNQSKVLHPTLEIGLTDCRESIQENIGLFSINSLLILLHALLVAVENDWLFSVHECSERTYVVSEQQHLCKDHRCSAISIPFEKTALLQPELALVQFYHLFSWQLLPSPTARVFGYLARCMYMYLRTCIGKHGVNLYHEGQTPLCVHYSTQVEYQIVKKMRRSKVREKGCLSSTTCTKVGEVIADKLIKRVNVDEYISGTLTFSSFWI